MSRYGIPQWTPHSIYHNSRRNNVILEQIPAREYTTTRSGKLKCLVCPWKPVFDNGQALGVHRNGKKHKAQGARNKKSQRQVAYIPDIQRVNDPAPILTAVRSADLSGGHEISNKRKQPFSTVATNNEQDFFEPVWKKQKVETLNTQPIVKRGNPVRRTPATYNNKSHHHVPIPPSWQASSSSVNEIKPVVPQGTSVRDLKKEGECKQYYARIQSLGWKRSEAGEWFKDPELEWESDDDEPPAPPEHLGIELVIQKDSEELQTNEKIIKPKKELSAEKKEKVAIKRRNRKQKQKKNKETLIIS